MRVKWTYTAFVFFFFAFLCGAVAQAENDVAASLYGAFSGTTTGNNVKQSPANQAGVLFELRHISNPLVGYEVTYSYNRANQSYSRGLVPGACPTSGCPPPVISWALFATVPARLIRQLVWPVGQTGANTVLRYCWLARL